MSKVSKSAVIFTLLFVFIAQLAETSFAGEAPPRNFEQRKLEVLELDLSSIGRSLSPYQRWLIYYWHEEYLVLLDVDTFAAAFESWKRRGAVATIDLSSLFDDTRFFYFRDLVARIHDADLAFQEKEFLELFLIFILNQGEEKFRNQYKLNALVDGYLSKYPDSPTRQFVNDYIRVELPPRLNSYSFTIPFVSAWTAAITLGSQGEKTIAMFGTLFEMTISHRNIVLGSSFGWLLGGGVDIYTWDISLGYRLRLSKYFSILPHSGIGTTKIEKIRDYAPTASFGLALELFAQGVEKSNAKLAIGLVYRPFIDPRDGPFERSMLMIWMSGSAWRLF